MHELLSMLSELRARATKMKDMIITTPANAFALREALYELEAAIYTMERAAADAYRAA